MILPIESVTATSLINKMGALNEEQLDDFINNITDNNTFEGNLLHNIPQPPTEACKLYAFVVYTIIVGSLCILGAVGNITAFVVFCKDGVKTSTSFLFQGLSLIDTFLLLCCFPLYSIKPLVEYANVFNGYERIEPYVLVFGLPLAYIAQTSTIWVTVLVGVNRYIAVCMPYRASRLCTVVQAKKQLLLVLLFAVLYNLPKFFEARIDFTVDIHNITHPVPEHTKLGKSSVYHVIYSNILYLIFLLILPLFILTILNIRLINALKALRNRRAEMQSRQQQQDNNVTLVLIIVVLVFTLCQAPALVNQILWNVLTDDTARWCGGVQFYYSRISNTLVIMNSAVNFIIYFFFNTRFRQVLIQNVCKQQLPRQNNSISMNGMTKTTKAETTVLLE